LYGLDAISANNGWSIAAVGIIIVFSGLVILAFVISQLHKVLAFIENPDRFGFLSRKKSIDETKESALPVLTKKQKEPARQLCLILDTMEDHFPLPKLIRMAEVSGLDQPYENLNNLLDTGIIEPDSDGFFLLNKDRFKKMVS